MPRPPLTERLRNLVRLVFGGGVRAATVDAPEAQRLQKEGAVVVDVRAGPEWRGGHIPGAVHLPMTELESRLDEIPRGQPVVVHCALGTRGALAAKRLRELGFQDVRNLEGGVRSWKNAGLPVVRDEADAPTDGAETSRP